MTKISKKPPPQVVNDQAKYVDKLGAGGRRRVQRTASSSTVTPYVVSSTSSTGDAFAALLAGSRHKNIYAFPFSQCAFHNVRRSHISIQGFKGLPQFRGRPMVDLVQASINRKQLETEMRVADELNNRMLQERQDTNIRKRAAQEKDFRAQQRQLTQKSLQPSREERMRMLDQQRATMITRNADARRIQIEEEAL